MENTAQQLLKLEGVVEHMIYENAETGYAVFEVNAGNQDIVVAGNVGSVDNGMTVTVYGHMVKHPSYGEQFKAESCEASLPQEAVSRVTGELLRLGASLDAPIYEGDEVTIAGTCTAAAFWDYPSRFAASTRGHGRIASGFLRYEPCKDQQGIVAEMGYAPLADEQNPPGSVFCTHGAGVYVAWDKVREWAHCEVET